MWQKKRMQRFLRIRTHKAYLPARRAAPSSIFVKALPLDQRNKIALTAWFFRISHVSTASLLTCIGTMYTACFSVYLPKVIVSNAYKLELSKRKKFCFILKFLID